MSVDALAAQYCTFRLGHLAIGVDVQCVREVIRQDLMTKVPLAPPEVKGLINLRGQIITAVDLRGHLGVAADSELKTHVVIGKGDDTLSLMVDEIGEVITPSLDDYEPLPAAVPEKVRQLVSGAFKLENRLLLVLDAQRVSDVLLVASATKGLRRTA